jgi:NADH-quinone oxidoreductase subunit F
LTLATYPQVLFQNRRPDRIATLEEYRASGGYQALTEVVTRRDRHEVQEIILDAALLGRGGAAFPAGRKIMSIAEDAPFPRYLVCNADEMEPGTFKDRVLIHADPHMLIEGVAITAWAVRAEKAIIFIRPEYENAARILEREIRIAAAAGYLGRDILGSNYSLEIVVHRSAGRYICGEVTAQLNALMGQRPNPKQPPPYATEKGLWGQPTLAHNVETLAWLPHIVRHGAEWFRKLALTATGAGTKIFCVSGKIQRPGCYELPIGVPLSEIIEEHAGGMCAGSEFKACLPGGASTGFLPRQHYDVPMDFDALKKVGNRMGTGAIMVFDHRSCLVAATLNLIEFFTRESCGWCTPCREGLPYIRDLLARIEAGAGEPEFVPMLEEMKVQLYRSYCAFAPGAAAPLESLLAHFQDEIQEHIRQKRCPFTKEPGPEGAGLIMPRFIA